MRRQHLALVICAFITSFAFADAAHAVYHPTVGRWLSRDPIGYADKPGDASPIFHNHLWYNGLHLRMAPAQVSGAECQARNWKVSVHSLHRRHK